MIPLRKTWRRRGRRRRYGIMQATIAISRTEAILLKGELVRVLHVYPQTCIVALPPDREFGRQIQLNRSRVRMVYT